MNNAFNENENKNKQNYNAILKNACMSELVLYISNEIYKENLNFSKLIENVYGIVKGCENVLKKTTQNQDKKKEIERRIIFINDILDCLDKSLKIPIS